MDTRVCITKSNCCTLKLRQHCKSTLRACMLNYCSHICLHAAIRTAAWQAFLSMWVSRQEYWSGLPVPASRGWQEGPLPLAPPGKPQNLCQHVHIPSAGLPGSHKFPEAVEVTMLTGVLPAVLSSPSCQTSHAHSSTLPHIRAFTHIRI